MEAVRWTDGVWPNFALGLGVFSLEVCPEPLKLGHINNVRNVAASKYGDNTGGNHQLPIGFGWFGSGWDC